MMPTSDPEPLSRRSSKDETPTSKQQQVNNSSVVSTASQCSESGLLRSARTPHTGRPTFETPNGGFSFSFRGVERGPGSAVAVTDSPNTHALGESPLLSNASVVALGPSCAMSSAAAFHQRTVSGGTISTPKLAPLRGGVATLPLATSSTKLAPCSSPIPLEPTDILEVNKSLQRSFHATPVIESQNVEKRTLIRKRQKMLNDKYILYPRQELGRGSYGKVVLCYSVEDEIYFAAKILQRHYLRKMGIGADSALLRVHAELDILKRLRHDNIIALHEFIDDGVSPKLYMIFELAAYGEVLKMTPRGDLADGEEPLPEGEVQRVIDAVVQALAFAHQNGVAHRDVKPENILITSTHAVKLADFGLAVADVCDGDAINRGGSVAFLPPELLAKDTVLSRATSNVGRMQRAASSSSRTSSVWKGASVALSLEGPQSFPRSHGLHSSSQHIIDHHGPSDGNDDSSLATPGAVSYRTDSSLAATLRQVSGTSVGSSSTWTGPLSGTAPSGFELPFVRPCDPPDPSGALSSESSLSMQAFYEDSPFRGGAGSAPAATMNNLVDFFKADVWSLGITTFFLLFGQLPWRRAKDAASLAEDVQDHPDPFYEILHDDRDGSECDDSNSNSPLENTTLAPTPTTVKGPDELFDSLDCTSRPHHLSATRSHRASSMDDVSRATPNDAPLPDIQVQNASWAAIPMVAIETTHERHNYLNATSGQRANRRRRTPKSLHSLGVGETCIDFIRQCLATDPMLRPSAQELQGHSWFQRSSEDIDAKHHEDDTPGTLGLGTSPPKDLVAAATTKHTTAQIHVRELEDAEQRDVPDDLQALLKAKIGPSSKRLLPLTFFDGSPQAQSSLESSATVSTMWSSPNSRFAPPHGMAGGAWSSAGRRSKDDSVIFTAFVGGRGMGNADACASGEPLRTPSRAPKVQAAPGSGGGGIIRHLDCCAIEASGATPYGQRSSWASTSGLWNGNSHGDKIRSPSSPNVKKNTLDTHTDGLQPPTVIDATDPDSNRRITLRELLQQVTSSDRFVSDMKHVSSGPL